VSIVVSRKNLSGKVKARFEIAGKGFDLSLGFDVAPSDVEQLFIWIQQKIIDAPETYLAHLFPDPLTWLKNVGEGIIDFAKDSGEAIGKALNSAFKVPQKDAVAMMKNAGYAANQVGAALNKAYKLAAKDATALLKDTGYAVEEVGKALESAYNSTAEEASKLLKDVGYGVKEVARALEGAFGTAGDECERLLKSVGFSPKDISNVFGSKKGVNLADDEEARKRLDTLSKKSS
jgi:phage-related protein